MGQELTKQEAVSLMEKGEKITHRFFSENEWMTIDDGEILFEDGVRMSLEEFWKYRHDKSWECGYYLIKQEGQNGN